jgi:hypothetical protein
MVERAPRYKRASDRSTERRTSQGSQHSSQSDTKRFGERGRAFGFVILGVEQLYNFREKLPHLPPSFTTVLGQFFAHFQILAMVVPAIKVAWPEELQWIARALSTIALDWPVVTFSLQCVRPLLYYDVLRGMLLVALPLVAGVFVHFWLISILCCCFCSTTTLVRFRARCTNVYLLLVFVLYAPVSLTIVKYFHCRDFSGGMFLMADPALRCDDALHEWWAPTAYFGLLAWVVGIPVLNAAALVRLNRKHRLEHAYTRRAWGLAYRRYRPQAYLWETVEVSCKLAFTSLIVLLEDRLGLQLSLFTLLAFIYVVCYSNRRPYSHPTTDRVAFAALVATFLLMVFALLIVSGVVLPAGLVVAGALLPAGVLLLAASYETALWCCRKKEKPSLEAGGGKDATAAGSLKTEHL